MFNIPDMRKVKLIDANPRSELHGKEHIPAIDLKFTMLAVNEWLAFFHEQLLHAFYKGEPAAGDPAQPDLEGVEAVTSLPYLRFPKMRMPIGWGWEGTGFTLTVDHGMGGRSNLVLGDCKVDGFKFDMKEGGTVEITWRLQASKVEDKVMGKLCSLIQHDLEITLTAPSDDQQSLDETKKDEPKKPAEEKTDATAEFVKRNT
jgi:hypothetical protein